MTFAFALVGILVFAVVTTWLLAPLHDPNDESLPMSMRGGPR